MQTNKKVGNTTKVKQLANLDLMSKNGQKQLGNLLSLLAI